MLKNFYVKEKPKMKKNISLLLICSLAAASFTACSDSGNSRSGGNTESVKNETSSSTTTEDIVVPMKESSYRPTEENVKMLGRTAYIDDTLFCALSGTGIEFSFTGTKCSITVQGDSGSTNPSNGDNQARVAVYVNGKRVIDDTVDQAEEVYSVIDSETPVEATVSLVKLSESVHSTIGIKEIKATGTAIKPTPNKDMFIEFIGDSITCGYGIDDPDKNHHFSTKTEDVTKAYGYLTAQKLNADYSMVSFSGYGIISGYTVNEEKNTEQTLPPYYDKLGRSWGNNGSFFPSNVNWDFSKRQPDLIVINLGTNDESYTKNNKENQNEFSAAYTEFLKQVREKNPNAKVLCVYGIMGDKLYPVIQDAIKRYTEETGKSGVFSLRLDPQTESDGFCADWHPSEKTHEKASEVIVKEITRIMEG